VAFHDDANGAVFTGEAIGSFLPWGPAFRPALPPPEVDVELALQSIDRIAAMGPTRLLTSHFGPVPEGLDGCDRAREAISSWSSVVDRALTAGTSSPQAITDELTVHAEREFAAQAGRELGRELARYDALGSIAMNAGGLARYWQKRREAEAETR
jgi:hypothetical protein